MKYVLLLILFCFSAIGAECPWINFSGAQFLPFDSDLSVDKSLSEVQVESDLKCLKILFENYYVAQKIYGEDKLSPRLNQLIQQNNVRSSMQLMEKIFSLHDGMVDYHLVYSLSNQEMRNLSQVRTVEISEKLNSEIIYQRKSAIYFRPGSLMSLSSPQQSFIEIIRKSDQPIILDLRGNGGGDDQFAFDLSEALFTKDQRIPSTRRYQLNSPLQRIGFSLSLLINEHPNADYYRNDVKNEVSRLSFQDLIPFSISEEVNKIGGKRASPYRSQIVLIIDGGCASSCETIVEKLSVHPRVKVVGQNTMGAIHFSNAATFMLPSSGIVVKLPTLLQIYENDAPEGVGYAPHEWKTYVDLETLFY